ncbi:bacitracin transport system permease protein [Alkalihalobacillus xiaoxiensis]|uniref:Bacitracin transport system permease protein n=1 Tax=Shouchella xiaoxiensis TaxID=766895 RepID=A0ABS2SY40_9BACI|nr:ABC transporter permease [Shouchella xiaoxiensis]MBM7839685.1 bacitracin transport system permease protein [Shouchella xiaoxiensis]
MNQSLALKNVKKQGKNYFIYLFALVLSVALYFSFLTLRHNPVMRVVEERMSATPAITAGSVMLFFILAFFLLYANNLIMKRRSQEFGLLQLIGMTKQEVTKVVRVESAILYVIALVAGTIFGYLISKLMTMLLLLIIGIEEEVTLYFSLIALWQTVVVFLIIYVLVMIANSLFIRKRSILNLIQFRKQTENRARKLTIWEIIIGLFGLGLIGAGYFISSVMFSESFMSSTSQYLGVFAMLLTMLFVLGSVIVGTYLFYRGSVSFIAKLIRKKQAGYMPVKQVLSLSSIMFNMKSSSLLLTIITTISALAIGLLSLSYIGYYSAEESAKQYVPHHFSFADEEERNALQTGLDEEGISYQSHDLEVIELNLDLSDVLVDEGNQFFGDYENTVTPVVSDSHHLAEDVEPGSAYLTGMNAVLGSMLTFQDEGTVRFTVENEQIELDYTGLKDEGLVSYTFASGGLPILVVDNGLFQELLAEVETPQVDYAIQLSDEQDLSQATALFAELGPYESMANSQLEYFTDQKETIGLLMFVVGFLGLAFLFTSGCILYIKQMDESEADQPDYTILRKLGFSQMDLLKGIQVRQLYNFGIPLIIGLLHSYFAVRSGWFFFGAEMHIPMLIVMGLYTALYSVFAILSVAHSKKIIRESL